MITFWIQISNGRIKLRLLRNFERIDSIVNQFVPDFLENSPTNSIIHQYVCDMYVY